MRDPVVLEQDLDYLEIRAEALSEEVLVFHCCGEFSYQYLFEVGSTEWFNLKYDMKEKPSDTDSFTAYLNDWSHRCYQRNKFTPVLSIVEASIAETEASFLYRTKTEEHRDKAFFEVYWAFSFYSTLSIL